MADISNNPFVDHTASVAARYPSIENVGSPSPSPYTNWVQPQQTSYGQAPQQQYQQPQLQQPQQPQYGYSPQSYQQTGYQSQPSLGQPSQSGFSQQQQYAQPTGYNPGYAQQPQPQQFTGYPQQQQQFGYPQQQQPQPTGYGGYQPQPYGGNTNLAQFDPYSNLGQTLGQQHQTGSVSYPNPTTPGVSSSGPQGQEHPRQYIQSHKVELESWDTVSWRQCISAFDALMEAWKQRQLTIEARIKVYGSAPNAAGGFFGGQPGYGYGGYGGHNPQAQEVDRLNGMLKEAQNNVDTTAAAKFQMTEVQGSYRHSSDAASKRRVREATNAAVQGLPDWPSNNF